MVAQPAVPDDSWFVAMFAGVFWILVVIARSVTLWVSLGKVRYVTRWTVLIVRLGFVAPALLLTALLLNRLFHQWGWR
jgi:hypothetical protein